MTDLLATVSHSWPAAVDTISHGWNSLSLVATATGLSGVAAVVGALAFGAYLPASVRHFLVIAGVAALVSAGLFEAGAHQQRILDAQYALEAEEARAKAAGEIAEADAARAAQDLQAAQSDNAKLKDLNDALDKEAHAQHGKPAPACVDRDLARRLRNL